LKPGYKEMVAMKSGLAAFGTAVAATVALSVAPAALGQAVFPAGVSSKYLNESARLARRHTCLDQYNANKAAGGNGGLNWIQKGGGYYSECSKRLTCHWRRCSSAARSPPP
jgi:hypothetical protein